MSDRVREFVQKNVCYVIVFLVSAIYVAAAVVKIEESGKTIAQILGDGAVALMMGVFITQLLDIQGIMNGERDERFKETFSLHSETVIKISPFIDRLDAWCEDKTAENLKLQRTRILATEGLKYDDYFDTDGSIKEITVNEEALKSKFLKRMERRRLACVNKALKVKLTPISAGELTSEGCKIDDPYNFGRTKEQYERERSIKDIVSRIGTAAIFGYYGVSLITDFSYDNLIWNLLQVGIFLLAGTIRMYSSTQFIVGEYRGRIVKKINSLEMFYNDMTKEKSNGTS